VIKLFESPQLAIEYAIEFNKMNDDAMALRQEGISYWINGQQEIFFPVLFLQLQTVTSCLELFHPDMEYEEPELDTVRQALDHVCLEFPDCRILTIGHWGMELWIPSTAGASPPALIKQLTAANKEIAKSLGKRWGRMGAVSPQPDRYYKMKGVYKLGIQ
jgi:hypothetical protein